MGSPQMAPRFFYLCFVKGRGAENPHGPFCCWWRLGSASESVTKKLNKGKEVNMIKQAIMKAVAGENLSAKEMEMVMGDMLSGDVTGAQIGAFVTALRIKGETVEEIEGAVRAMKRQMKNIIVRDSLVNLDRDEINIDEETILDTSGTGGDSTNTFNVSTATAFVVAGGGVKVAKHGSRAVSSRCGSADVLEALGIKLDINTAVVEQCVQEIGIGFIYMPISGVPLKYVAGPRREIGIRTIFNLLGPLTNPADPNVHVLGVYSLDLTEKIAQVLKRLGSKEAFVVCGEGTYDEISICGPTRLCHLRNGTIETSEIEPEQFGLKRAHQEHIRGGNAAQNAQIVRDILDGERGPKRDMVLLNAAAAFVAAGLDEDLRAGMDRASESIDSGCAKEKLTQVVTFTQQCSYFSRYSESLTGS